MDLTEFTCTVDELSCSVLLAEAFACIPYGIGRSNRNSIVCLSAFSGLFARQREEGLDRMRVWEVGCGERKPPKAKFTYRGRLDTDTQQTIIAAD